MARPTADSLPLVSDVAFVHVEDGEATYSSAELASIVDMVVRNMERKGMKRLLEPQIPARHKRSDALLHQSLDAQDQAERIIIQEVRDEINRHLPSGWRGVGENPAAMDVIRKFVLRRIAQ